MSCTAAGEPCMICGRDESHSEVAMSCRSNCNNTRSPMQKTPMYMLYIFTRVYLQRVWYVYIDIYIDLYFYLFIYLFIYIWVWGIFFLFFLSRSLSQIEFTLHPYIYIYAVFKYL